MVCSRLKHTHTHTHAYKYKHEHIFTLSLLSLTLLLFTFSFCLISIEMSLVSCWVSFAASVSKKSFGDILLLIIGTFVTHCTQYLSPCNFGRSHAVHNRRGWSRVPFFESAYICWYFGEWTMIKWHPLGEVHSNVIAKMCAQICVCVCLSVWEGIRVEAREKCKNKWTNPNFYSISSIFTSWTFLLNAISMDSQNFLVPFSVSLLIRCTHIIMLYFNQLILRSCFVHFRIPGYVSLSCVLLHLFSRLLTKRTSTTFPIDFIRYAFTISLSHFSGLQ